MDLNELNKEVTKIQERNKKVELDKAWETSLFRRLFLASLTYVAVLIFLFVIKAPEPYFAALIPALAYLTQQYSLPFLKNHWEKSFYKK